jgi:hypothetical protein
MRRRRRLAHLAQHLGQHSSAAPTSVAPAPADAARRQFEAFGYLVRRGVLSPAAVARLSASAAAGAPPRPPPADEPEALRGASRRFPPSLAAGDPFRAGLLESAAVLDIVEHLLGPGFLFLTAAVVRFGGDTPWHWDGGTTYGDADGDYRRVKVCLYLDDLSAPGAGSLSIIPGSHARPFRVALLPALRHGASLDTADWSAELGAPVWGEQTNPAGLSPRDVPAFETCTRPADLVFFSPHAFHSSFGPAHRQGKRSYQLLFGARPRTAMERAAARLFLRGRHPERMDDPDNGADQTVRGKNWNGGDLGALDAAQAELCGSVEPRVRRSAKWVLEHM